MVEIKVDYIEEDDLTIYTIELDDGVKINYEKLMDILE